MAHAQSDTTILTYNEYLENIIQYHPIAKKADLKIKFAKAEMLSAKGNLDPEIYADWNQKNFSDKLYYRQYQTKLKLPTRYGVDVVGGYENTEGVFLNPENKTDKFGLWHLGLEVNVLQGLLVNERRTALDQAKIFQDQAKVEQQLILNDLIYNATTAYLTWQQYVYFRKVLVENEVIADTYFNNTKESFFSGEKTAMDTLEAYIAYQDVISLTQKNELGLIKSRQMVENYLWYQDLPIELQNNTIPENYINPLFSNYDKFENANLSNHPNIQSTINKLSLLALEQKLKREKLKPKLKIKYNPLLATSSNSLIPSFSVNDYKWGFNFSMPLLMRSERAAIQQGEVKIQEANLDIDQKRNELQNKIESSWLQQFVLQEQVVLLGKNVESYRLLLEGENEKFNYGESSVFLLNKRQEKYINGQFKLIETSIAKQVELLNFLYFSNQLISDN
ncbi:hypothetical protein GCM10007940_41540 [Portibacter lacus]|uniref:Transporter n=1 Tax=Portibacter lacus TaxID=1099794 RepID=A0AA37SSC6_9BACT|nr:hypothetical protein GCM10007940_41540 [Portibacter lacus]